MGVSFCMTIHHVSGAEKQVKCGRSRGLYSACFRRHSGMAGESLRFFAIVVAHRHQFPVTSGHLSALAAAVPACVPSPRVPGFQDRHR
jgi:hypothetical protein